jgi:hypothetical protein
MNGHMEDLVFTLRRFDDLGFVSSLLKRGYCDQDSRKRSVGWIKEVISRNFANGQVQLSINNNLVVYEEIKPQDYVDM